MVPLAVPPALTPVAQVVCPVIPDAAKIFRHPAEDLLVGLPAPLTAAQKAAFHAVFGPILNRPTHPAADMIRIVDWIAAVCYPDLPLGEGRRRHGRAGTAAWSQSTILGRVLTAALPMMGMERVMRRVPTNIGAITNFATRTVYRVGPGHWWYTTSDDPTAPEFAAGVMDALGEATGARQLTVQWATPSSHERIYEIRWTP